MKLFSIIIGTLLLISCSGQAQNGVGESKVIGPKEFKSEMQAEEDFYLIDVRTPEEYKAGTIKGATNLNIYSDNFNQELDKLDKEKPVYVFCAVGGRSGQAAKTLKQKGFKDIIDLKGGFTAWKKTNP
jgi:rhodanese-related sulfurtransferase